MFEKDQQIKIIIADDHEIVRSGIRRLLTIDKSFVVVDEAKNGQDAVELTKYHKPDVILMDILMPRMNGTEAVKIIKEEVPGTYVIMLTAFEDYKHIEDALSAGADGYLSKEVGAKELNRSIKHVLNGERVLSSSVIITLSKNQPLPNMNNDTNIIITKREQEILNHVALGYTSSRIADLLHISVRTVESHRYNIMQKLGVNNTATLVRYAVSTLPDQQVGN